MKGAKRKERPLLLGNGSKQGQGHCPQSEAQEETNVKPSSKQHLTQYKAQKAAAYNGQ